MLHICSTTVARIYAKIIEAVRELSNIEKIKD
jgi:hypothetical protein